MRFNIVSLCAFLGTATQLVAATEPGPPAAKSKVGFRWNSPETQGAVMIVGANCAAAALICDAKGQPLAKWIAVGGVYCCAVGTGTIVASRGDLWEEQAKTLGDKAKVGFDAAKGVMTNSGKFISDCTGRVCRMVESSKVTGKVVNGAIKGAQAARQGWAGIKKTGKVVGAAARRLRERLRRGRQPTPSGAIMPLSNLPRPRPRARSIDGSPKRRNSQRKQRRSRYRKMRRSPIMQIRRRKPMKIDYYY